MSGTEAADRPLTAEELELIDRARQRAAVLYRGETVPHHSCGASLAVTFGKQAGPYQSLRRGGISGTRFCGSIRGGELVLGEILGDPSATGAVTPDLREATLWFQQQVPLRFAASAEGDYLCNHLTAPRGDFMGRERKQYCTGLTAEVAALAMEAVLRFAPDKTPSITGANI